MSAPSPVESAPNQRSLLILGTLILLGAVFWFAFLIRGTPSATSSGQDETSTADTVWVSDEAFAVSLPAQALRRIVQMAQWREVASVPLATGDEIITDEGAYQLVWSEIWLDSQTFAEASGHANPAPPSFRSQLFVADGVMPPDSTSIWQTLSPAEIRLPENLALLFRVDGQWLTSVGPEALPQPGDLRVGYAVLKAPVSTPAAGLPDADDRLNDALHWIARAAAFVLVVIGVGLCLRGGNRRGSSRQGTVIQSSTGLLLMSLLLAVLILVITAQLAVLF